MEWREYNNVYLRSGMRMHTWEGTVSEDKWNLVWNLRGLITKMSTWLGSHPNLMMNLVWNFLGWIRKNHITLDSSRCERTDYLVWVLVWVGLKICVCGLCKNLVIVPLHKEFLRWIYFQLVLHREPWICTLCFDELGERLITHLEFEYTRSSKTCLLSCGLFPAIPAIIGFTSISYCVFHRTKS